MISTIAAIAAGGAIGALARHGVNVGAVHVLGHGYPYGTMIVNILGSFIMGILIVKFSQMDHVTQEMRAFFVTGILGAFTTFSTFSLDFANLVERQEITMAALYAIVSVVCAILALFAGLWLMRSFAP